MRYSLHAHLSLFKVDSEQAEWLFTLLKYFATVTIKNFFNPLIKEGRVMATNNSKTTNGNNFQSQYRFGLKTLSWLKVGALGLGLSLIPISGLIAQSFPDTSANPLYGTANLSNGFSPNPYSIGIAAGGSVNSRDLNLGTYCTGYITASQPDFRVNYQPDIFNQSTLIFAADSSTDTTLLINDPNGSWHCADDTDGLNPRVNFSSPQSGQYDVWVGVITRNDTRTAPAQLRISENSPIRQTTSINFCNQTSNPIFAAYAAFEQNNGWRSVGWHRVEPQQCRDVSLGREYRGNVYVYGEYNQGERYWGGGSSSFCVNRTNAFNIPFSDQATCNGSDVKRVPMSVFNVGPGQNTWRLTSGDNPGFGTTDNQGTGVDSGGRGNGGQDDLPSNCLVNIGGVCVLRM